MAYDKDIVFKSILSEIEEGASLRSILRREEMPNMNTFLEWVDKDKIKANQYARAIDLRTELKFESIEQDYLEEPQRDPESGRIDSGWVQLQRLKIDAKKWELSKLKPKKYGDKTILSGDEDNPIKTQTTIISLGSGINPNETT
jgi:hypothetical protein